MSVDVRKGRVNAQVGGGVESSSSVCRCCRFRVWTSAFPFRWIDIFCSSFLFKAKPNNQSMVIDSVTATSSWFSMR